ncbi:hypothetical protein ACHAW5_002936 [Stephanodiscus triporus]|uniref:Uncharacterized protein n=1 Tax=Stephanodiscus triporus TaxID=2934178 RepID=A0ABD3NJK2_9STRA
MNRDNDARTTIHATRHRAGRRRRRRDDDDVGASSTTAVVRFPGGRTPQRRRLPSRRPSPLLLPSLFLSFYPTARVLGAPYVVTWSGGKEDKFFCGTSYEDASIGCPTRQNCRSGRDDECLPFVDRDGNSIPTICYADTACDSMDGGGKSFVGDVPDGSAAATTNSTVAPTLAPVRPLFSNDPADHKFCGKTWNDANGRCHLNCRTMLECGELGEVCFDTSNCDARTAHPSTSQMPTPSPTTSYAPTATITTAAPTAAATKALTDVQLGFFCGNSWSDVTSSCRKRCPSGEDPECPGDETCFAFTGCPEERGYGEDPSGWVPGFDQFGDPIAVTDADGFADGVEGGDGSGADGAQCKGVLEIAITPDNWPKEISWDVVDTNGTEVLSSSALPSNASNATSLSSGLVAGETTTVTHCVNPIVGCRVFTIRDDGGDGLCCDHGEGGYEVRYQGELIKSGSTFYDSESVEFGCGGEEGDGEEGETTPTQKPGSGENPFSIPSQTTPTPSDASEEETSSVSSLPDPSDGDGGVVVEGGGDGRSSHRCASRESVEGGYQVPVEDCDILTDCYNQYIETGDDWFCTEDEVCVVADECGVVASEASSVIDGSEGGADGTRPAASPARPTSGVASSASVPESMPPGEVAPPSKEPTNGPTSSLALTPYPTITSSSTGSPTEMATSSLPSYLPSSW